MGKLKEAGDIHPPGTIHFRPDNGEEWSTNLRPDFSFTDPNGNIWHLRT
ncbi:MAG TPA: hypothetical protein VGK48_20760 [Terriglobia bacterium]